jgi:hypothetical protein
MAPKPFLEVIPSGHGDILIMPSAIKQRPELLPLITHIIATWTEVEAFMASILATILTGHAKAAIAMFYSLSSTTYQFRLVDEAAEAQLNEQDYELFQAVYEILQNLHVQRNKLAHWRYGICKQLPDALLLAPPSHNAAQHAAMVAARRNKTPPVSISFDVKSLVVYSKRDIEELLADVTEGFNCAHDLWVVLYLGDGQVRQRLSSLPRVAAALSWLRQRRQSAAKAPRQSRKTRRRDQSQ